MCDGCLNNPGTGHVSCGMQPVYARQAFPCFDEPALKATFLTTLLLGPEAELALSNMPLLGGTHPPPLDPATGLRAWAFQQSPVMSSYLNAWVIGVHASCRDPPLFWAAGAAAMTPCLPGCS